MCCRPTEMYKVRRARECYGWMSRQLKGGCGIANASTKTSFAKTPEDLSQIYYL